MAPERTNKFTIMLSDDETQQLEALAESDGSSVSEYVRRLVKNAAAKADWVTLTISSGKLIITGVVPGAARLLESILEKAFPSGKLTKTHFAAIVEEIHHVQPDVLVRDRTGQEKITFDRIELVTL